MIGCRSGFLKWYPGEKVWSGTGNASKSFLRIQRNYMVSFEKAFYLFAFFC